jgi:undecaprenyl-diphosphatase
MNLELWHVLVLAVVQGIGEFLPISSSGHVVIVAALLAGDNPDFLDVAEMNMVLHIGTLFSIFVFYAQRIGQLLTQDRQVLALIVIATVPGVAVGLAIKFFVPWVLESPTLAGAMLLVTGTMLIWISRWQQGEREYPSLTVGQTLLIGISQAVAILPGISRSGTTISMGLRLGLAPAQAATFSFLMAIPIIAGGGVFELLSMARNYTPGGTPVSYLVIGGLVSFVVGLAALYWLIRWLQQGRFQQFAWWCIPVGLAVLVWQGMGG